MIDPGVAQDLLSKATRPLAAAKIVLGVRTVLVAAVVERVRRSAQSEDWFARMYELVDVFHLLIGEFAETRGDHHHVGRFQLLEPRNIRLVDRVDFSGLGINREQDGAVESVPSG